jgi:hypothetical protein
MPGGLIQIASYGSQDLTLTGNPQITFFKIVFRRYTNFGIRTVEIAFDNPVNFGDYITITVPKSGDLLTKATLKIKLPSIDLTELNSNVATNINVNETDINTLEKFYLYYDFFINFINKLKNIVNTFFSEASYDVVNITYILDLKNYILTFIQQSEYLQFFKIVNTFLFNDTNLEKNINYENYSNTFTNASLFKFSDALLIYIYENYNENYYSYDIFKFMIDENMKILDELNVAIYQKLIDKFSVTNLVSMGWINKIGIFIMDRVEMFIGSNLITKLSSNYIDIYGQLNYKNVNIYNKLIGNNQEINITSITKNEEYLYTPLPFWFQNNYGLAVPLIALQFNNLQFKFKLRELIELIFFNVNDISAISENLKNQIIDLILSKTINIFTSQLEITLLVEYVYLDNIERKKFAQSSHEYLITQVQELTFTNVTPFYSNFELDFFHCCKTMYWSCNQYKYLNNLLGKNIFDKYTTILYEKNYYNNDINYINFLKILYASNTNFNLNTFIQGLYIFKNSPINADVFNQDVLTAVAETQNYKVFEISPFTASQINLNGVSLVSQTFAYFNYLQPYNYFKNTPSLGINVYSFSLSPTETQPAGSCNLSRIPKTSINFKMYNSDQNLNNVFQNNNVSDNLSQNNLNYYKINVQVENYNILRFIGGIVGIAFTY